MTSNGLSRITRLLLGTSIPFLGCSGHSRGEFAEAKLPMFSYVQSSLASNGRSGKNDTFPLIEVYDAGGGLVYRDRNAETTLDTIERLSNGSFRGTPITDSVPLAEVIGQLPLTRAYKAPGGEKLTIVEVSLDGCQGCTVVDGALTQNRDRILDRGASLIVVHVQQPA
jgi:hypothetical protein